MIEFLLPSISIQDSPLSFAARLRAAEMGRVDSGYLACERTLPPITLCRDGARNGQELNGVNEPGEQDYPGLSDNTT